MKLLKLLFVILLVMSCITAYSGIRLPEINFSHKNSKAFTNGNILVVSTGKVERIWKLTKNGFVTESIKNQVTGKVWTNPKSTQTCDWQYSGLVDESTPGTLVSLVAKPNNDEAFTSDHIEVIAEFKYPNTESKIQYKIWVYSGTCGIRTQAFIKSNHAGSISKDTTGKTKNPWVELRTGTNSTPYAATEKTDLWYASSSIHEKSVELRAFNLNPKKKYMVGFSWWDWENGGGKQQVRVASVDGEADQIIVPPTMVPDFKGKNERPAVFAALVPDGINVDGTIRIFIDNVDGKNATVSEVWILEENGKSDASSTLGEEARLKELIDNAKKGYGLVAYLDCGTDVKLEKFVSPGYADFIPVLPNNLNRRYMGYYNDTQHRNKWNTPIYREVLYDREKPVSENINWANILSIEEGSEGIMLVKESHKCVNQYGADTGDFLWNKNGVLNTGTSLLPEEISSDKYKWFWGSWTVIYDQGDEGRELALKQFDRYRYPVIIERDMYTVMCTWGHSKNARDGRNYATEPEVLKEMNYVAETGIDMLLIDDGWQCSIESQGAMPDGSIGWRPHPLTYPNGWKNIVEKSKKLDLKLGLWGIAQQMPAGDMIWNWQQIKMNQMKLDFARFDTHDKLNNMMDTVRRFILGTNHKCNISWDLTENAARYGYFWAREYGNLHFMNRKPFLPMNVLYVPSLALRDFWLLAKYNNLNKYQLVIQNPEVVDHASDAYLYSPEYCVAMALMGVPEFMAVTRFYSPEARANIKRLLDIYKKYREDIFTSYVFPIGDEPTNASWTGFQSYNPDKKFGYLTLFRELNNKEDKAIFQLRFLKNQKIRITNLQTGDLRIAETGATGELEVENHQAASFQFLKYEKL
jgi:hypothetical protein